MSKDKYLLFVDNEKYEWESATITGAELRALAAIPQGVEIYLKVPGNPDEPISDTQTVDLATHHGVARFSTQSPGSQAG